MGIHEYPIPSGGNEPGFARGDIRSVTAGEPRTVESTPYFHATARDRPLTAAAHELGHILTAPHASAPRTDCSPADGRRALDRGRSDAEAERGRLQSTKFIQARRTLRGSTIPAVPSRAVVDGPYTRADGSTSNPPLYDLMSYCASGDSADGDGNAWLSARNWNRFARELGELGTRVGLDGRPRPPLAAAARAAIRQAGSGPQAGFAIGVAGPGGGKIMRVMPPDGDDAPPGGVPSSPFRLRSLGAAGEVLLDAGVAVRASSEAGPEAGGAFSGPVASAAVAVELVRDGTVLDRLQRSRPPTVRLLAPRSGIRVRRGGRLEVRWQASDPDGGDLHATVDFSPDGRTWRTVHEGPSVGRVAIPGRLLAAGRRARVRLSVSDGFAARTVTSRPFRTEGAAPQVRILAPGVGALVRAGDRVVLAGSALDAAGQPLTGRSLTWYAGRERLGTGARLRTRLPAGTHDAEARGARRRRAWRPGDAARPRRVSSAAPRQPQGAGEGERAHAHRHDPDQRLGGLHAPRGGPRLPRQQSAHDAADPAAGQAEGRAAAGAVPTGGDGPRGAGHGDGHAQRRADLTAAVRSVPARARPRACGAPAGPVSPSLA